MEDYQEVKYGGVKAAEKNEKESEEQIELRLGRCFERIKFKYKGVFLKDIEDKQKRDIVRRIRAIDRKNKKNLKEQKEKEINNNKKEISNTSKFVKKYGNEKMARMIIGLIKTKNATEEQINKIAQFYGVDLGKIQNIKEENER